MIDRLPGDIFRQGQVLNHTYEIEGVLGRGGTGAVYRARNKISGRIVAIKALNAQFSGNDDYIQLMRREEQMRYVLNDAVVRYTECSRSDQGHVFLVMDFIDGPSMNDVMMRRSLVGRELMIIAHRGVEGLVAAHARGLVHRDLSPDNVVLRDGAADKARLIDFGIAQDFGGQCNLRFDDTNPVKEEQEYVDNIKEDIRWLGYDWEDREYYASDYFEELYQMAVTLIKKGKAYVCDLTADELREYRGTPYQPGRNSPHRERSVEENLDLFARQPGLFAR